MFTSVGMTCDKGHRDLLSQRNKWADSQVKVTNFFFLEESDGSESRMKISSSSRSYSQSVKWLYRPKFHNLINMTCRAIIIIYMCVCVHPSASVRVYTRLCLCEISYRFSPIIFKFSYISWPWTRRWIDYFVLTMAQFSRGHYVSKLALFTWYFLQCSVNGF